MKPYGLADDRPPESTIFRRVVPLNCEWLLRPPVRASEFADTIEHNLNYLAQNQSPIVNNDPFKDIQTTLSPFIASLQKLNTLNDLGPATPSDVKQLIKTMVTDDQDIDAFFDEMVKIGWAMLFLGTHFSVVKSLMTNLKWYAENRKRSGPFQGKSNHQRFQTIPNIHLHHRHTTAAGQQKPKALSHVKPGHV